MNILNLTNAMFTFESLPRFTLTWEIVKLFIPTQKNRGKVREKKRRMSLYNFAQHLAISTETSLVCIVEMRTTANGRTTQALVSDTEFAPPEG